MLSSLQEDFGITRQGASLGCGWMRWPPYTEGSCRCTE